MHKPSYIALFFLALFFIPATEAEATVPDPEKQVHHLEYKNTVVLKGNPSTLLTIPSINYHLQLAQMKLGLSVRPLISITQFRPGVDLEFSPIENIKFLAGYERAYYFKSLFSFRNPSADWSDGSRSRSTGLSTNADFFNAALHLKIPIDKFIFRNRFKLTYAIFEIDGNDEIVYDEMLDIPLPIEGFSYTNETDVLYVSSRKWIFGLRYTTSKAFLGEAEDPNGATHRVGPLASHVFYAKRSKGLIDTISGFILLNWYIKHRFRTGREVSPLVPYSAIGFSITGTLL